MSEENGVTLVTDDGRMLGGYFDVDDAKRAPYQNGDLFQCETCGERVFSGFTAEVAVERLLAFLGIVRDSERGDACLSREMESFLAELSGSLDR